MKKFLAFLMTLLIIFLCITPACSEEEEEEYYLEEPPVEELEEFDLPLEEEEDEDQAFLSVAAAEIQIEEEQPLHVDEQKYNVKLSNMQHYSIIALNDAYIDAHIRGSIWVGGTLTSSDWCGADDDSINHKPSKYESYIYNNESNMYFKGRTDEQSKEAYNVLTYNCVESVRTYWK